MGALLAVAVTIMGVVLKNVDSYGWVVPKKGGMQGRLLESFTRGCRYICQGDSGGGLCIVVSSSSPKVLVFGIRG